MLSNKKILIVDDIPQNIQLISTILSKLNADISFATSGPDALNILENDRVDLVLLDIAMEGMDGFEVCRRIKEMDHTDDLPVIFLTARTHIDDVIKGFESGAVDYITKPFNSRELTSRVSIHLELKESKDIIERQKKRAIRTTCN